MADETRPAGSETRFRRELRVVIRRARERLTMSQDEFARALGAHLGHPVSQSQISDWERGRFEPAASILLAVAEMANLSIDELRGAGPPALLDRVDRLEEDLAHLVQVSPAAGEESAEPMHARMASVEREISEIGELLARIVRALDHAGLWPDGHASDARSSRSGTDA